MISPFKFKVRELFTGNKNAEEWTLPEGWEDTWDVSGVMDERQTIFDKNFVLLDMCDPIIGIYMVLNLVSRKLFWMEKDPLEDKILEKVAEVTDENGEPYILEYVPPYMWNSTEKEIRKMKVEQNQIVMKHYMELEGEEEEHPYWGLVTVNCDLIFKLDDQNEITDYEVVNVEVKSNVRRCQCVMNPQRRAELQELRNRQAAERFAGARHGLELDEMEAPIIARRVSL